MFLYGRVLVEFEWIKSITALVVGIFLIMRKYVRLGLDFEAPQLLAQPLESLFEFVEVATDAVSLLLQA